MAINAIKAVDQNGIGHLAIDDEADLLDLPAYAKSNNLKLGTDVICVETGDAYMMKSDYTFKKL